MAGLWATSSRRFAVPPMVRMACEQGGAVAEIIEAVDHAGIGFRQFARGDLPGFPRAAGGRAEHEVGCEVVLGHVVAHDLRRLLAALGQRPVEILHAGTAEHGLGVAEEKKLAVWHRRFAFVSQLDRGILSRGTESPVDRQ